MPSGTSSATSLPTASTSAATATPSAAPEVGWRQRAAEGEAPSPRADHTWTVTPDGATAYLFGGQASDGSALGDVWAYDLATDEWSRIDASGPPARFGHSAAWVDGIGLVVFAGQAGGDFFNDLWAFDPAADAWRQLPATGDAPLARYGSCAAIGPDGRLWISHGFTASGQRFADTRAYDFETDSWTDETPVAERPVERCLHGCWWTDDGALALYAGQTNGVMALGDLWHLTAGQRPGTNAWVELPVAGPPGRNLYASARTDGATLVFGGQALDGSYLADAWSIADNGSVTQLTVPGAAPPGRAAAELIRDVARGRFLLFGGRDGDGVRDDLWELTLPSGS